MTNTHVQEMKKYLRSYRSLRREVIRLRAQLSDLERSIRLPALHMECGSPKGVRMQAERRRKALAERMEKMLKRCREVEEIIDRTEGPSADKTLLYREILRLRYLDGLTFCAIADQLHYTDRHVRRLHREGLAAAAALWKGEGADGLE